MRLKYVAPGALACAILLSACAGESTSENVATTSASEEDDLAAARAACDAAISAKWNTVLKPEVYGFNTTGSGDSYTTGGRVDVLGAGGRKDRYAFECTTSRVDGVFVSEITESAMITTPTAPPATSTARTQPPASTTTRTPIPLTSTALSPRCKTPSESTIAAINASFKEDGYYLADVYMVYGAKDVAYIGANIMDADGQRASSSDIWADKGGLLFSLSGDARRRTSIPDGRHLLDISAGDEYGQEVSECIQTAVINRNSTGGR